MIMKSSYIFAIAFALSATQAFSQSKKEKDIEAIKSMCGCYEVKFNFAEVYSPDLGYDLKEPYQSQATELITLISEEENKVSMQHILQVSDEMIIKHWRQDWHFEDDELLQYDHSSIWQTKKLDKQEIKGSWTQSVSQVDDSPRYEGYGTWTHRDSISYWEGVSDAPLPRRDLKSREDYNVMNRRNRHTVFPDRHLHEEDNKKINRSAKYGDEIIAIEKGYNTYTKVDDSRCAKAKEWWEANNKFWEIVREEWATIPTENGQLQLDFEDGKNSEFYMAMFGLNDNHISAETFNAEQARKDIRDLMNKFHIQPTETSAK